MGGLLGKKLGMTRLFGEDGRNFPVTVIQAGPCVVVNVKTKNRDGYEAIQVGFEDRGESRTTKPMLGVYKKAGVTPKRHLAEMRGSVNAKPGDVLTVAMFGVGERIRVRGVSKGRGFTGVVKRHGFRGGPKSHGQSDRLRAPGSLGASSNPSRVWPGQKMAGRHGGQNVLVRNLEVVRVDEGNNRLFLKGAVPGGPNGLVVLIK